MKNRYVFILVTLILFGVVNTYAFNLNTIDTSAPDAYTVQTFDTDATISQVQIKPSQSGNVLIIKFQLTGTDTETYTIGIELEDNEGTDGFYDASGSTITPTINSNSELTQGYFEFQHVLSGASDQITIRVEKTGIYADVDGLLIMISGGDGGGTTTPQIYTSYQSVDHHPETAIGTHSSFSAMQAEPDTVMNTLTEEPQITASATTTLINYESFEGSWPPHGWSEDHPSSKWDSETDEAYHKTHSADFDGVGQGGSFGTSYGRSGILFTPFFDCSDAVSITVDFWYYDDGLDAGEFLLEFFDGYHWDTIVDLGDNGAENTWRHYKETITDSQYLKSNFMIRWRAIDVENGEHAYLDYVLVQKTGETTPSSYELDLEVEWTGLPQAANEYLRVYGGTQGAEGLKLEIWDGSSYVTVINDIQPGWNDVDVSAYHTGSTFNIRLRDATQSIDPIEDSWEIDSLYLELWD